MCVQYVRVWCSSVYKYLAFVDCCLSTLVVFFCLPCKVNSGRTISPGSKVQSSRSPEKKGKKKKKGWGARGKEFVSTVSLQRKKEKTKGNNRAENTASATSSNTSLVLVG